MYVFFLTLPDCQTIYHLYKYITAVSMAPCEKSNGQDFTFTLIADCKDIGAGGFGTGNASILLGFLNCFLWSCNTWFLYKETAWYRARNQAQDGVAVGNI